MTERVKEALTLFQMMAAEDQAIYLDRLRAISAEDKAFIKAIQEPETRRQIIRLLKASGALDT